MRVADGPRHQRAHRQDRQLPRTGGGSEPAPAQCRAAPGPPVQPHLDRPVGQHGRGQDHDLRGPDPDDLRPRRVGARGRHRRHGAVPRHPPARSGGRRPRRPVGQAADPDRLRPGAAGGRARHPRRLLAGRAVHAAAVRLRGRHQRRDDLLHRRLPRRGARRLSRRRAWSARYSRLEGSRTVAEVGGPSIAAGLYGALGAFSLVIDAASYLVSAWCYPADAVVGCPLRAPRARSGTRLSIGFRLNWADPVLRRVVIAAVTLNSGGPIFVTVLPILAYRGLGPLRRRVRPRHVGGGPRWRARRRRRPPDRPPHRASAAPFASACCSTTSSRSASWPRRGCRPQRSSG